MTMWQCRPVLRTIFVIGVLALGLWSCGPDDPILEVRPMSSYEHGEIKLSDSKRRERIRLISSGLRSKGLKSAILVAGIADAESNLAHCHSEATWACEGPGSASCGGGAVIAGAADGPCNVKQGGLGMFQFDSGTHSQTLAAYGQSILTVEGNAAAVLPFFVKKITGNPKTAAKYGLSNIRNEAQLVAWMNSIRPTSGDRNFQNWLGMVSCLYNGSCSGQKIQAYSASTTGLLNSYGESAFATGSAGGSGSDGGGSGTGPVVAATKPDGQTGPDKVTANTGSCRQIQITRTSGDRIRVRSSPGNGEVIGHVQDGQSFQVLSEQRAGSIEDAAFPEYTSDRWFQITLDGQKGWVSAVYADCQ